MARVKKINAEGSEELKDSTPEKEKKGVENMRAAQTLSCFSLLAANTPKSTLSGLSISALIRFYALNGNGNRKMTHRGNPQSTPSRANPADCGVASTLKLQMQISKEWKICICDLRKH